MAAAQGLARVVTLTTRAMDKMCKSEYSGAASAFDKALDAALALGAPDCLIVAYLQADLMTVLTFHASTLYEDYAAHGALHIAAQADAAFERAFHQLLPPTMAVLERRRRAGTLLPGACRPAEEAWFEQARAGPSAVPGGPLVGVEAFITASHTCIAVLRHLGGSLPDLFHLGEQRLLACGCFLAQELDLVAQPWHGGASLSCELGLLDRLRDFMGDGGAAAATTPIPRDHPAGALVWAAWERLQHNPAVQARLARDSAEFSEEVRVGAALIKAQSAAATAARGLRCCALPGCGAREYHASQFKHCAACKAVCYCSKVHQTEDWPSHKAPCKAARKAAAADAHGAGPSGA